MRDKSDRSAAATSGPDTALRFPDVTVQVALTNAAPVAAALGTILHGWVPDYATNLDAEARQTSVIGAAGVYAARSSYLDETIDALGVAGAACAVIADLAEDYFSIRPGCLALHCAAFSFNNRLIAMTGPSRAGKSTLAARMTLEDDIALFCDDVLPLLPTGNAVGLGIAPRLRLPIPAACTPRFQEHVARHLGPRDDRYGYLCAPTVAPHGTSAPLSVLLILDRRDSAPAHLHAVAEDEALHFLLSQNMSDLQTPQAAFTRLTDLLAGITCLRLVYSDLEDAVALIRQAFGSASPIAGDVEIGPVIQQLPADALPPGDMSADQCWLRNPDVVLQSRGDSAFLWVPGKTMIWRMNTLARAVWALLEIPGTAREIAQLLAEQFPRIDKTVLIRDVTALLQALSSDGLIEPETLE
ncbi:PqqD family protein [Yoonia sp.]|uniref:PqqD family protein n=1 Tax=Yoonia sp. TaxID=2212373 RepID=UPI00391D540C